MSFNTIQYSSDVSNFNFDAVNVSRFSFAKGNRAITRL